MTSGRPDRNEELEQIVDHLGDHVAGEREAQDVPSKPSERAKEPKRGSADEPTAKALDSWLGTESWAVVDMKSSIRSTTSIGAST